MIEVDVTIIDGRRPSGEWRAGDSENRWHGTISGRDGDPVMRHHLAPMV